MRYARVIGLASSGYCMPHVWRDKTHGVLDFRGARIAADCPLLWDHDTSARVGTVRAVAASARSLALWGRVDELGNKSDEILDLCDRFTRIGCGLSVGVDGRLVGHSECSTTMYVENIFEVSLTTQPKDVHSYAIIESSGGSLTGNIGGANYDVRAVAGIIGLR